VWWHTPAVLALGRLRQEGREFEASLGYTMGDSVSKKQSKAKQKTNNKGRKHRNGPAIVVWLTNRTGSDVP
jgi:hypothetical protein